MASERPREHGAVTVVEHECRGSGGGANRLRSARTRDRDDGRGKVEQPRERDLGRARTACIGHGGERVATVDRSRPTRAAERGVRDHDDARLLAPLDDTAAKGAIVERVERDLHGRDRADSSASSSWTRFTLERPKPNETVVDESREGAHGRVPRGAWIRSVEKIEVDGQAVECSEAGLAVRVDRLCAAVRNPVRRASSYRPS